MTGVLAVPDGGRRVTVCCGWHRPGPLGSCCSEATCLPCCPECPSCPRWEFFERFNPGWRRQAVLEQRRWQAEFWGERRALAEIGAALEWWDRGSRYRCTSARPNVALIVRTVRRVREAIWSQEVPF